MVCVNDGNGTHLGYGGDKVQVSESDHGFSIQIILNQI